MKSNNRDLKWKQISSSTTKLMLRHADNSSHPFSPYLHMQRCCAPIHLAYKVIIIMVSGMNWQDPFTVKDAWVCVCVREREGRERGRMREKEGGREGSRTRVSIWPFLKLFARNKMVWLFGHLAIFLGFFECWQK